MCKLCSACNVAQAAGCSLKSLLLPRKASSDNVCKPKSLRVTDSVTNSLNEPQAIVLPAIFSKR